ncbi:MAG: PAS domain S-box protein [Acidimicrobiaceae bacterium]|nr:PAS domain S-box protein [Acidimicrobiaceae bacterium]
MSREHIPELTSERLVDLSIDMLGTATFDGYFTVLNAAWAKTLGWTIETLMAEPYTSFVHPDDLALTLQCAANLTVPGTANVSEFENRYRTSSGTYRWFRWSATAADDIIYFVAHDITAQHEERVRATQREEALLESQDFVIGLSNSIAEGIFAADHNGRTTYLNDAAQRMLGWSDKELLGSKIHEVIHFERLDGSEFPIEKCPIVNTAVKGEVVRVARDVFIRRNGTRLPVSYSSSPLHQDGVFGSVVVFDDITTQLATELKAERELDKLSWIGRVQDCGDPN